MKLESLERWVKVGTVVRDTLGKIEDAFMASPENSVSSAVWGMFSEYTRNLATQLGDDGKWLDWFAWECDFGRNPKEVVFADGERLLVIGASDLFDAICTDENGCRVFVSNKP